MTVIDVAITHAVQRIDVPGFAPAMVAISAAGYAPVSWYVMGGLLWSIALLIISAMGGYAMLFVFAIVFVILAAIATAPIKGVR